MSRRAMKWKRRLPKSWQRVLGIANIGINDDFLDLGGDSLAALQLMSRLRETFDVEPPLARFFESPTNLASVALLVVQQLAGEH